MNPEIIEKVLSCPKLPSIPAVAVRVLELSRNPNVSFKDIAETISGDVALTAKVLKTVNSSFYGLRKPCSSINQAIVMLGLSAVKSLALGFSLVSSISRIKGEGFDIQAYWRRSLIAGVSAKCVAVEARTGADEECFLGGLLQDVGMMAMFISLGVEYTRVLADAKEHHQLSKAEFQKFEMTHAEIGALLATRWKLPDELIIPIRYHERPTAAPQEYVKIAHAVALGNAVADVIAAAQPGPALKHLYAKAEQWMAMKPAQCDELITRATQATREMARLFEVDAGQLPDAEALLTRAGKQLETITLPTETKASEPGEETLDPVTGLPNRLSMNRTIVAAFEQAAAGIAPLSLAVFALDQYQSLTTQDVALRDGTLRAVGSMLAPFFAQRGGVLFRYDPKHFGVVLRGCDRAAATVAMESARDEVGKDTIEVSAPGLQPVHVKLSICAGVASLDATTRSRIADAQALVTLAEGALTAAQRAGMGTLRVYAPRAAAA